MLEGWERFPLFLTSLSYVWQTVKLRHWWISLLKKQKKPQTVTQPTTRDAKRPQRQKKPLQRPAQWQRCKKTMETKKKPDKKQMQKEQINWLTNANDHKRHQMTQRQKKTNMHNDKDAKRLQRQQKNPIRNRCKKIPKKREKPQTKTTTKQLKRDTLTKKQNETRCFVCLSVWRFCSHDGGVWEVSFMFDQRVLVT